MSITRYTLSSQRRLLMFLCTVVIVMTIACTEKVDTTPKLNETSKLNKPDSSRAPEIDYYTCSMHPQIHRDHPGNCPICGMTLVPVYKQDVSSHETPHVVIAQHKKTQLGLTTAPVQLKSLTRKIQTFGEVAFDPDLIATQKDYLEIQKSLPELEQATRDRLALMGMSDLEIDTLSQTKKTTQELIPHKNIAGRFVYAKVYGDDRNWITHDLSATIIVPENETSVTGVVRGISPIIDAVSRATTVRIEITNISRALSPNQNVRVVFNIKTQPVLTIPKSALIATGERNLVYIMKDGTQFSPRTVS